MGDEDITQPKDKVSEQDRPAEKMSEKPAREATDSMGDLIELKKHAMADQKDPDRLADPKRAKFASYLLGRPEIFDPDAKDGQALLKGLDFGTKGAAAQDTLSQERPTPISLPLDTTTTFKDSAAGAESVYAYAADSTQRTYTVQKGDNLTKIARQELGQDASALEVHNYVREAARLNGIKDPNLIVAGQELRLPENNKRAGGDDIGKRNPDVNRAGDANAAEATSRKVPTNESEFLKEHRGLIRPAEDIQADSQAAKQQRDAKIEQRDQVLRTNADLANEQLKTLGLTEQEAKDPNKVAGRLKELQESNNPEDRARAEKAERLEGQIKETADKAKHLQGEIKERDREIRNLEREQKFADNLAALPPKEKAQIIQQLDRILAEGNKSNPTIPERQELVRDIVHQIANPSEIRQGQKDTCGPASDEAIVARGRPTAYAEAVANWALKGEHNGIKLPAGALKDDGNPDRSLTSRVFQSAAANFSASLQGGEYINERPGTGQGSGEYLAKRDPSGKLLPRETWEKWGGTTPKDDVAFLNKLTGGDNYTNTELKPAPADATALKKVLDKQLENGSVEVSIRKPGLDGKDELHSVRLTKDSFKEEPPGSGKFNVQYEDPAEPSGKGSVPLEDFYRMALKGAETVGGVTRPKESNTWNDVSVSTIHRKTPGDTRTDASIVKQPAPSGADLPPEPQRPVELPRGEASGPKGEPSEKAAADPNTRNLDFVTMSAETTVEGDKSALDRLKEDPRVQERRDKLEKLAEEKIEDPQERQQFLENMKKFEERIAERQAQYQKEFEARGMSPEQAAHEAEKNAREQVENTYKNVERLLETNDKAKINEQDRVILAQQALQHAADPTTIAQGIHGTCAPGTVESRTFTKDPAEATRLIADVATTGSYTGNGSPPITVKLNDESLKKHAEAHIIPRPDGKRDYASQIFQVTAVNVALERENQKTTPPGKLRYEQDEPKAGQNPPDTGDRIVDYSKDPPQPITFKGLKDAQISALAKEISPGSSEGTVLISRLKPEDVNYQKARQQLIDATKKSLDIYLDINKINGGKPVDLNDADWAKKVRDGIAEKRLGPEETKKLNDLVNSLEKNTLEVKDQSTLLVKNEEEMKEALAKLKREGKLPVIVAVHTSNEPFWTDSNAGAAGGSGGGHVVTITDFNEKTGVAKIQNQWDRTSNHDTTARELFRATQNPEHLEKQVAEARNIGRTDYVKEVELLALQKRTGKITDQDYDNKIIELASSLYQRKLTAGGNADQVHTESVQQLNQMLKALASENPERVVAIQQALQRRKQELATASR